jgi:membrane fusion protein, copper/silver efflux system
MQRLIAPFIGILSLALLVGLAGCGGSEGAGGKGKQKFHCPMHPTYVSDRQGDCPICNMKLVPIREGEGEFKPMAQAPKEKTEHIAIGQYYCPMHPEVVSDTAGTCPECEMFLIQKRDEPDPVPGRISIMLSPEKRQLIGLTLAEVEQRELDQTVRTTAVVEHDERRYTRISPRFAGWIRKLHVNFTGAPVEKGQPLFTVYSPELFAAENEYLVAWRSARQQGSGIQQEMGESLLDSARLRLSLFEIGDEEIRELEKRGKPSAELLFRAPFSGHVTAKNAVEGASFAAGETLFEIADLSHLWLRALVFERELPLVAAGQDAVIRFPYLSNRTFPGKVTFMYPHIDAQTRRGQVRLELDNTGQVIRPEMWANVEIKVDSGSKLTVPASAIINTGERYVAFVHREDDQHLEPRDVKIGMKTDDYYEVISGLKAGEQVVSRALFLVDSESQLKAAIAGMGSAGGHDH